MTGLAEKTVLITGGSSGIGRATARLFAEAGAHVHVVDLRAPENPLPGCRFTEADVASFAAAGRAVEEVLAAHGALHCLVNNAGISRDAAVWNMTEEQWDAVLDVDLKGAFNFIHHAAPHFRREGRGKIVSVSSINGLRGKFGLANYAAAKAGLLGLTKTVARELGPYNVNVNAVAPGLVLTPLTEHLSERFVEEAVAETVLRRLATPEDVAHAILFLCSDWARHITGAVLRVDGGQYL